MGIAMILHRLMFQHVKHIRDLDTGTNEHLEHIRHGIDRDFSGIQARDSIAWLKKSGVKLDETTRVLDLGCGNGYFGAEFLKIGCDASFADVDDYVSSEIPEHRFYKIDLNMDDLSFLGRYDLVIFSNVFEHLAEPARLIALIDKLLAPKGALYFSWTNWLSPWGGHEFSPFHYLGPHLGPRACDRVVGKPRVNVPFETIFLTYIGRTLRMIRRNTGLRIVRMAPRYYSELSFITRVPILREFLTWNCAILIESTES
jgi:SAM-dependent methyltransferase